MNRTLVVVADGRIARFYDVEEAESPRARLKLSERESLTAETDLKVLGQSVSGRVRTETNTNRGAGPVHPMGAQRERHRLELERRFGMEIARRMAQVARGWKEGTVILVADPRLLGLMRGAVREALHNGVELKELAKDYTQLTRLELQDRLFRTNPPARRQRAAQ